MTYKLTIVHIRTENINGGYRKGGLIKEDWRKNTSQYRMPDTFTQIKICPFEDCLPRFSREAHPNAVVIYILSNLDHLTVDSIINSPSETIILKAYSI